MKIEVQDKKEKDAKAAMKDIKKKDSDDEVSISQEALKQAQAESGERAEKPEVENEAAIVEELELVEDDPEELPEEEQTYKEQLQRLAAEFDNYRKRTAKEKMARFDRGVAHLAEKLLPVVDNLDSALESAAKQKEIEPLVKGIEMVRRMLVEALESNGINAIEITDKQFDPRFHEAVCTQETTEVEPDTILNEMQKGYMHRDRIIRPAMVSIAVAPRKEDNQE